MSTLQHAARKPGRPRSAEAQQAVLEAVGRLIETTPIRALTIEGIARAAGVGKPTIYRWWDSKCAVVMDAFVADLAPKMAFPATGSALDDLRGHVTAVVALMRGRAGRVIADIIGEGQAQPEILDQFRKRIFELLAAPARAALARGVDGGEFDGETDLEMVADLIYGPIFCRLMVGHQPLDDAFVDALLARLPAACGARVR